MVDAPGWKPDPEREDRERYWTGSAWTDRVRPGGKAGSLHVPEHVPQLHRALSAATADIDAVEDRLSELFDRSEGARAGGSSASTSAPAVPRTEPVVDEDEILVLYGDEDEDTDTDEDGAFAELDAALASEEPDEPEQAEQTLQAEPKRGRKLFRRRT